MKDKRDTFKFLLKSGCAGDILKMCVLKRTQLIICLKVWKTFAGVSDDGKADSNFSFENSSKIQHKQTSHQQNQILTLRNLPTYSKTKQISCFVSPSFQLRTFPSLVTSPTVICTFANNKNLLNPALNLIYIVIGAEKREKDAKDRSKSPTKLWSRRLITGQ